MEIEYDALVIAVGARNTTFGVKGVAEHALFLKELSDARAIRRTIIRNFEQASFIATSDEDRKRLLSFVVVGGGPTGIEFAAELHDLIKEDLSWQYPDIVAQASIKVVERGDVLGAFDEGLRKYCRTRFARQGIQIVRETVGEVQPGALLIEGGAKIPFGMLVWSTGIAPRQLIASRLGGEFRRDGWGHLVVDQYLRAERPPDHAATQAVEDGCAKLATAPASNASTIPSSAADSTSSPPFPEAALRAALRSDEVLSGIFALGDCAAVEGKRLAATAQVAEQQGTWLAREMNRRPAWAIGADTVWQPSEGFAYKHQGSLAYVGSWTSVSDFTGADAKSFEAVKGSTLRGWASWLVWRSAYLTKLGTWRNRLQVPSDWLRTFLWGRDTSLF